MRAATVRGCCPAFGCPLAAPDQTSALHCGLSNHLFCFSIFALSIVRFPLWPVGSDPNRSGLASLTLQPRISAMPISTEGQPVGPHRSPGRVVSPYLVAHLDGPHRRKPARPGKSARAAKEARDIAAHSGARRNRNGLALKPSEVRTGRLQRDRACGMFALSRSSPVQRFARLAAG